eukprot:403362106
MKISVHLQLKEEIDHADRLVLNIKGKERFRFMSTNKNWKSTANKRQIVDENITICRFMPSFLSAQDYTFLFNYKIPDQVVNQWPASFMMKRDVPARGELKLQVKYQMSVMLLKVGQNVAQSAPNNANQQQQNQQQNQEYLAKQTRRFFIAKKPFNPRQDFIEATQQEVFRFHRCISTGINKVQVKFERNYYLSNEKIIVKCKIDNSRSKAKCPNIFMRLIRTIKAYGYLIPPAGQARQNNLLFPWEENVVVATREFPGVPARHAQKDFSQEISIFLDAIDQQFKLSRRKDAQGNMKLHSKEDLAFAQNGLQPSTVGQIFNCLYTIIINRSVRGLGLNYPTGISVLATVNPSIMQVNGFEQVTFTLQNSDPENILWNPKLIDLSATNLQNQVNVTHQNNIAAAAGGNVAPFNSNQGGNNINTGQIVKISQMPNLVKTQRDILVEKKLQQFKKAIDNQIFQIKQNQYSPKGSKEDLLKSPKKKMPIYDGMEDDIIKNRKNLNNYYQEQRLQSDEDNYDERTGILNKNDSDNEEEKKEYDTNKNGNKLKLNLKLQGYYEKNKQQSDDKGGKNKDVEEEEVDSENEYDTVKFNLIEGFQ